MIVERSLWNQRERGEASCTQCPASTAHPGITEEDSTESKNQLISPACTSYYNIIVTYSETNCVKHNEIVILSDCITLSRVLFMFPTARRDQSATPGESTADPWEGVWDEHTQTLDRGAQWGSQCGPVWSQEALYHL